MMKRLIFSLATVFLVSIFTPLAIGGPYDTWTYKMDLTLDKDATLTGPLADAPVLVKLTPARTSSYNGFLGNGADLRFAAGGTPLDFEIESWNPAGDSYVWVKAPTIATGASTKITAYWGNPSPDPGPSGNVWSNNYVGVWHMNSNSPTSFDSSPAGNHGTPSGASVQDAPGQINGGVNYTATNAYTTVANDASTNFTNTSAFSLEGWINITDTSTGPVLVGNWLNSGSNPGYYLGVRGSGVLDFMLRSSGTNYRRLLSVETVNDGEWHHLAATYNGNLGISGMAVYIDGELVTNFTTEAGGASLGTFAHGGPLTIGANRGGATQSLVGLVDEPRISNVVRNADWISATYLNGIDNFIDYGAIVEVPEPGSLVLLGVGLTGLCACRRSRRTRC